MFFLQLLFLSTELFSQIHPNTDNSTLAICQQHQIRNLDCELTEQSCLNTSIAKVPCYARSGDFICSATIKCEYCFLKRDYITCEHPDCSKITQPTQVTVECHVYNWTKCVGIRTFTQYRQCQPPSGKSYYVTFWLSTLFGSFGADRFYLGYRFTGTMKLCSFGGFGLWALIDWIALLSGKLVPSNGSFS